ncbi:unnamed protein product [Amoebophrya sp. A120]|nr:unnamed protein product [Amoebophrya sp. A120]|eukprot:GSA120T00022507001.1
MGRAARESEVRRRTGGGPATTIQIGKKKQPEPEEEKPEESSSEDSSQYDDLPGFISAGMRQRSKPQLDPDEEKRKEEESAAYMQKMMDMSKDMIAQRDAEDSKKIQESSKALSGAARQRETEMQTFLQEKTDDVDLQHRQKVLESLTAEAHVDKKVVEFDSESDQEMVDAAEIVKEAQRKMGIEVSEVRETVDILRDKLMVKNTFWGRLMFQKAMEEKRRKHPDFVHPFPKTYERVNDLKFEGCVAFFMVFNGVTLALGAERHPDGYPVYLTVLEHIFTFVFVVEATMRYLAFGWPWLLEFYNAADVFLIFFTGVLVMWILEPMGIESEFMRNFSILRLLRLLKLMRTVRAVPEFELVWRLIRVGVKSGKLLMWAIIDTTFIMFLFGIFFTVLVGKADAFVHDDTILDLFGDVPRSAFTAFQVGTRNHWTDIVRHARDRSSWAWPLSMLCITSLNLVMFNLVTASMIMSVFDETSSDKEIRRKAAEAKKAMHWKILVNIFKAMDEDDSGEVSAQELDHAMNNNPALQRRLNDINLHRAAMGDLWSILDVNGDGVLDMEEFLEGMRQMEGPAKSYDLIKMNVKCSGLQKRIHKLGHWFMATIPEAKRLAMLVDNTHGNMMSLFGLLRPLERDVLRIVRHMAEENELKTDEFGMPTIDDISFGEKITIEMPAG